MSADARTIDFHAGQLVMVGIEGQALDAAQAAFLRERHVRAVVLFRHNLGDEHAIRTLTAALNEAMGPYALIAIDQEGGAVVRATSLPQPPAAMALGAAGDEALTRAVGAAVARGVASLGFNWNFAPVLDVNNNAANPVIGERSFSEDPASVARLGASWMRGALEQGVACCVKHFPGHGDTHVDSHEALPVVDKSRTALDVIELLPFRALRREAPAIMTAHILYPQLDANCPATLSPMILDGILRREWGYDGVVITDSLVMKALHERHGQARAAVAALQAGADMVMALGTREEQAKVIDAIAGARADGTLAHSRLACACGRLDRLAERFPAASRPYPADTRAADEALMNRASAESLVATGDARAPSRTRPLRVITQRTVAGDGVAEPGVPGDDVATLFGAFADVECVQADDLHAFARAGAPTDARLNVLVSNIRQRYPAGLHWTPDLHVVLWNPFQALDFAAPSLVTWGFGPGALAALRAWLEGRLDARGCAPVRLVQDAQSQNAVNSATKS